MRLAVIVAALALSGCSIVYSKDKALAGGSGSGSTSASSASSGSSGSTSATTSTGGSTGSATGTSSGSSGSSGSTSGSSGSTGTGGIVGQCGSRGPRLTLTTVGLVTSQVSGSQLQLESLSLPGRDVVAVGDDTGAVGLIDYVAGAPGSSRPLQAWTLPDAGPATGSYLVPGVDGGLRVLAVGESNGNVEVHAELPDGGFEDLGHSGDFGGSVRTLFAGPYAMGGGTPALGYMLVSAWQDLNIVDANPPFALELPSNYSPDLGTFAMVDGVALGGAQPSSVAILAEDGASAKLVTFHVASSGTIVPDLSLDARTVVDGHEFLRAGDLNGDGNPEVMLWHYGNCATGCGAELFVGLPDAGLAPGPMLPTPPGFSPDYVVVADLDGDGREDLLVTSGDNSPALNAVAYVNQGGLGFTEPGVGSGCNAWGASLPNSAGAATVRSADGGVEIVDLDESSGEVSAFTVSAQ